MRATSLILIAANLVYATSPAATRVVLDDVPPALLAMVRLLIGAAVLVPTAWAVERPVALGSGDRWRVAWMGILGFAAAFALSHWGIERSTATNAALLIIVEPVSIMVLGPAVLGERLPRREQAGAALALLGALLVVLNGIPGVTHGLAPHWRGDVLLVVSGVAYGAYTLIGRTVLQRHGAVGITARSIVWGAVALAPLVVTEWLGGKRPVLTLGAVVGALYLGGVITALGYLLWNWALARAEAARVAAFVALQPVAGALLGVVLLREPLTVFTVVGGTLVVAGLWLTATGRG